MQAIRELNKIFKELREKKKKKSVEFCTLQNYPSKMKERDFAGGVLFKNLPAIAGDAGSSPGPGRSHMPRSN